MQCSTLIGLMITSLWFPQDQRTLANGVNGIGMVAGLLTATGLSPAFVNEGSDRSGIGGEVMRPFFPVL